MSTDTLSEEHIRAHCPHCDPASDAFADALMETEHFRVVCDHHPLIKGHILIIPKAHLSCIGEYPEPVLREYEQCAEQVSRFVQEHYGTVSMFEHGKLGQTVFHSHTHFLPFGGDPLDIIPESMRYCTAIPDLRAVIDIYRRDLGYLLFSINDRMWIVDPALAVPRFFRDRFAVALGRPERGNWKTMHVDRELMEIAGRDNVEVMEQWKTSHR